MSNSNRYNLPLLSASQAQKHVTVNETFNLVDTIIQSGVIDKDLSTPPGSPSEGDSYIVGSSPTGAWAGQAEDLATYQDGTWVFVTPLDGFLTFVSDESALYVYDSGWDTLASMLTSSLDNSLIVTNSAPYYRLVDTDVSGYGQLQQTSGSTIISVDPNSDQSNSQFRVRIDGTDVAWFNEHGLGLGDPADATNGLNFEGTGALMSSTGDMDLKINKGSSGDDAMMTFQSGAANQARLGLLGDNTFTVQSGASLNDAIVADADGDVTFPNQTTVRGVHVFGGRWTAFTDGRWVGPLQYANGENITSSGGTGATPNVDWDAKGNFLIKSGSTIHSLECSVNVNSSEITSAPWKLYYQYPDTWDGLSNSTGEFTRVEVASGTHTPAGLGFEKIDFTGGSPYTAPADGHLLLVISFGGTITSNRYFYATGLLDVTMNMG